MRYFCSMRSLTILMFAFAIAIGTSCGNASATAINLGQDYDIGIFAHDLGGDAITYNHFALAGQMFVMDFYSHTYYVPVTIGRVVNKPKTTIEVRARDSLKA